MPMSPTARAAAALARAQLQSARAHLCPHGVARAKTKCADCERPAPETTTTEATEEQETA